ncbi:MAG: UDP-N-acetylmuramate dehydrogenase [Desulfonatronovibrionaceae bacterium]
MRVYSRPDLAGLSTLRLGGTGRALYLVESTADLREIFGPEKGKDTKIMFMGEGSNILFTPEAEELVLVKWAGTSSISVHEQRCKEVVVAADAGVRLPRLIGWCAENGLSGLEPLAGIPGSVGGAVAMNAGAHGVETGDLLTSVRVWTAECGEMDIQAAELSPKYREMGFPCPGSPVVVKAWFALRRTGAEQVKKAVRKWFVRKKSVQPVLKRTAGCVFKNPGPKTAGRILDELGFRGMRLGGVGFSRMHANFLVHEGGGTSEQALELIRKSRDAAWQKKGIRLETEIRIIPCP